MIIVLDTNVFVSGVFWRGAPYRILDAWSEGRVELCLSPSILDEYARLVENRILPEPVCSDPDDDKFLACAIEASARCIVSGDKALLRANGYHGLEILAPSGFVRK